MVLRKLPVFFLLLLILAIPLTVTAGVGAPWHDQKDLEQRLKGFGKSKRTELTTLGESAGGQKLQMLTIHPVRSHLAPAVLVIGNPSGRTPLGTEAALHLIGQLLDADGPAAADVRWFILPAANPDAAAGFFAKPRHQSGLNLSPVDQDSDGDEGEDPADDLNQDGLITTMLVPDPQGQWMLSEIDPLLPVKADAAAGQRGLYRRETEGRDDDQDGLFNEDGPGGVNPARNFPHRYEHWTDEGGRWAADQPETRAILEFAFDHPEIGMILVLDRVNNLRQVPEPSELGANGKYVVSEILAARINVKAGQGFSLEEIKRLIFEATGNRNISDGRALRYLEEDAAVLMPPADHQWWSAVGQEYREFLDAAGMLDQRLPSPKSGPGSVEEWGYFQFGVPTFAVDFWSLPLSAPVDSTVALAETEDAEPDPLSDKQKALLEYTAETRANSRLADWQGLLPWEKITLDSGPEVLIGGLSPFAATTPPAALVDSLLATSVQYLTRLPGWLPTLEFGDIELKSLGDGVYDLTVWLLNNGSIPYPCAQGVRTRRVPPIVVNLEGGEVLDGTARTTLEGLPAHGSGKVRWLLRLGANDKIEVQASSPSLGTISKSLSASGGGK